MSALTNTGVVDAEGFLRPADQPLSVASVDLAVRDLSAMRGFYETALGLAPIESGPGFAALGVQDPAGDARILLRLYEDPALRPNDRRAPGLFHTAFLLPTRRDLALWLAHAERLGLKRDGAADHAVSEAVYLSDPEGGGVEIYADKPFAVWPRAAEGRYALVNEPLDVPGLGALAREVDGASADWRAPAATVVGHAHLQTGDLGAARRFHEETLGLSLVAETPGAAFFGSGGYDHQLSVNVWRSGGAAPRPEGMAGLARVRLRDAGAGLTAGALHDPFGVAFEIEAA